MAACALIFPGHASSQGFSTSQHDANKISIPVGGNSWTNYPAAITNEGHTNWSDPKTVCKTFLRVSQPGMLRISLRLNAMDGIGTLAISIANIKHIVSISGNTEMEFPAGEWSVSSPGYLTIEVQGIEKSGSTFGVLTGLIVSGTAISADASYVHDNDDNYFYWGRRGPSVHLKYKTDGSKNIEWFYSEITVPAHHDVIGSYFMANGFNEGYFGIQVNSENERRVLFSVWSPYKTDDPARIPEAEKIKLVKKGRDTYTGEFGNEGAGGQSYLKYPWRADVTYKFLLHGKPDEDNHTSYTAYFFAPEENQWKLIASFSRPKTSTYLTHLHSFLENFMPETGDITRMAQYGNQWVMDAAGQWIELTQAVYTGDNTARQNFRKDYAGGIENGNFYLKNCGFFNEFTDLNLSFTRPSKAIEPNIDFSTLKD